MKGGMGRGFRIHQLFEAHLCGGEVHGEHNQG